MPALDPAARTAAARKAAATRRANRAAGVNPTPTAPGTKRGPVFSAPKPDARGVRLVALAALEDAFIVKLKETGVTQEARDAFAKYEKVKALALAPATSPEMQTESNSALRHAVLALVKLVF
jgi:hypothetical protein